MRVAEIYGGLFFVTALIASCRDVQTEKEVTTRTSTGDAAVSMSGDSADKRGVALVRVVNGGGDTIFDGVNFASEAGYRTVQPGTGALEIRSEDGNRLLLSIPSVTFQKGHSYTVVLTRNAAGKLESIRFDDSQLK